MSTLPFWVIEPIWSTNDLLDFGFPRTLLSRGAHKLLQEQDAHAKESTVYILTDKKFEVFDEVFFDVTTCYLNDPPFQESINKSFFADSSIAHKFLTAQQTPVTQRRAFEKWGEIKESPGKGRPAELVLAEGNPVIIEDVVVLRWIGLDEGPGLPGAVYLPVVRFEQVPGGQPSGFFDVEPEQVVVAMGFPGTEKDCSRLYLIGVRQGLKPGRRLSSRFDNDPVLDFRSLAHFAVQ